MKKVFKVGVIVLILGVILLGIGFFNSGNKAIYFENNRPAIFHSHTKTISTNKAFERIDISALTANVIVREGKKYQITYSGISKHSPAVTVHNNVASIRQTDGFPLVFNFNDYQPHQDLIVNTDLKLSEITGLKMYFFTGLNAVLYVVPCNPSCDMIYQKF